MAEQPLVIDRPYILECAEGRVCAAAVRLIAKPRGGTLTLEIETHRPLCTAGTFAWIDPAADKAVAAGTITAAVAETRSDHSGLAVWFTGLSGSGKSTLCAAVEQSLRARGRQAESLDGDQVRRTLNRDLGFNKDDRDENVRRLGFAAGLLARNGTIALVAAISPYRAVRDEVRAGIGRNFVEVYVNAPLAVCEARDQKGLYAKARAGELRGFTGIDDPYEAPLRPEVECRTDRETVAESTDKVLHYVTARL